MLAGITTRTAVWIHPVTQVGFGLEVGRLGGPGTSERPNWWSDQTLASADRRLRSHAICAKVLPGVQSGTSPVVEDTPQEDVLRFDSSGDRESGGTAREQCPGKGAPGTPGIFSPLCVPKKNGKMGPVADLREINRFVQYHHFIMEGIATMQEALKKNDFIVKVDLINAFMSMPVHPTLRRFL